MKRIHGSRSAAVVGSVALSLFVAGCAGGTKGFTPVASGPNAMPGTPSQQLLSLGARPDHKSCALVKNTQDFNSTPIKINNTIWFASVFTIGDKSRARRLLMEDSTIQFSTKNRTYTIKTPAMELNLARHRAVRLDFSWPQKWHLDAPLAARGKAFLNGVPFRVERYIGGGIKGVTWSAKFYSDRPEQIEWRWGAAVYSKFSNRPKSLDVKPLRDSGYRPHNDDAAGSPENFKDWLVAGGTGMGGTQYRGALGPKVAVKPCR